MEVKAGELEALNRGDPVNGRCRLAPLERETEAAHIGPAPAGADAEADPDSRGPGRQQGKQALELRRIVDVDQRPVAQRVAKLVVLLVRAVEDDLRAGIAQP